MTATTSDHPPAPGPALRASARGTAPTPSGRVPVESHTVRPWRIHELAPDFTIEDVWALPTPGGPEGFDRLISEIFLAPGRPEDGQSGIARLIWAVRWKLGEWLGWDRDDMGLDSRVASLRERLPADLRSRPATPDPADVPFRSLYLLDDEWAAEIANRTVHGVVHIGWVEDERCAGGYRGQLAVLVKPNGLLGRAYLAAITPFRLLVIYPALLRHIGRQWSESA